MSDQEFGPHMAALNERQRAFVIALFTGISQAEAYRIGYAGSCDPENSNAVRAGAARLASLPHVRAAMREWAMARLGTLVPKALETLETIAEIPGKDRLKAVLAILSRSGLAPNVVEEKVEIDITVTIRDKWKRLVDLMRARGESEDYIRSVLDNLPTEERDQILQLDPAEWQTIEPPDERRPQPARLAGPMLPPSTRPAEAVPVEEKPAPSSAYIRTLEKRREALRLGRAKRAANLAVAKNRAPADVPPKPENLTEPKKFDPLDGLRDLV